MRRGLLPAAGISLLLVVYVVAVADRVRLLLTSGEGVGVALGVAVAVLPALALWFMVREWTLAIRVQRMADALAATGELPRDDLPRSRGGRIDRPAALAAFGPAREAVEADPESWRAWYHLAFAYDAAGDRRGARSALRTAAKLFRGR